jgi:CheY-like chemotaxis protein
MATSAPPAVVLLDLLMPGMSGFEVLEALRTNEQTTDVPVIILTAKPVTDEERELLEQQTQGLIDKATLTRQSLLEQLHLLEAYQ